MRGEGWGEATGCLSLTRPSLSWLCEREKHHPAMYIHTYIHTYIHSYIHTYIHTYSTYIHTYIHTYSTYLLDIPKQPTCMKLRTGEFYEHNYTILRDVSWVHTCRLLRDIQQIYCSAQTGQHLPLQGSCCPVWALQHIHTYIHTYVSR